MFGSRQQSGVFCVALHRIRGRFASEEDLTNDWWGLHAGDDDTARAKRRPKAIDMRKGVELRTCYITVRDGVKVGVRATHGGFSFLLFSGVFFILFFACFSFISFFEFFICLSSHL